MSDMGPEILRSLNRLHERMDESVKAANMTNSTVIRIEEKQIASKELFEKHQQENDACFDLLNEGLNDTKERTTSLEGTRDRVKWTAKYVGAPLLLGSSGVAAKWGAIMKVIGMR